MGEKMKDLSGPRWFGTLTLKLSQLAGAVAIMSAVAVPYADASAEPLIVGNDRGGYLAERVEAIDRIRALRQRVEIRGRVCHSACTMYLGAGNICLSPDTRFGFHGPSSHGTPIEKPRFEHWSRVMASYYSRPLRDWFMSKARHKIRGLHVVSGRELIRLGYPSC